jgi:anthranilate synthase component I
MELSGRCSCHCVGSKHGGGSVARSSYEQFMQLAEDHNMVPVYARLAGDQITPVTAFSRLLHTQDCSVPSYLFESVQNGTDTGRFSFVGVFPALEILAKGHDVVILDHEKVWL